MLALLWSLIIIKANVYYYLSNEYDAENQTDKFTNILVDIAKKYDVIPLSRPRELCTSDALIEDVMQYAFYQVKEFLKSQPKYISILLCNSCNVIANTLDEVLDPVGVAVVMEGRHLCMQMRGVAKQNSFASTSAMLGQFRKSSETRAEFLSIIQK